MSFWGALHATGTIHSPSTSLGQPREIPTKCIPDAQSIQAFIQRMVVKLAVRLQSWASLAEHIVSQLTGEDRW